MQPADRPGFRQIGERQRLGGAFLRYVNATFVDPDGFTFEREIVRHPGAVCIVPLEADGKSVLMVRQYRGALDRMVLELPAGKLDVPGEAPELCARRELIEEVGREATSLTELGRFHNSPGFTDETTTCYLAEGRLEVQHARQGVEEQHMTIESIPLAAVPELFASGELSDAKSLIAISLAERVISTRSGQ